MDSKKDDNLMLPDMTKDGSDNNREEKITVRKKSGLASIDFRNIKWTWKDVHLSVLLTLITFGDAVEIYLPGVITQSASEELGVSKTEEGILGIILYLCMAFSFFILPSIKNMIGRKTALLTSLYTSIIATGICALVPNYWTLIASRALLGLCIGLNMSIVNVYFAEEISSYDMYNVGKISGLFAFTLGGGWSAVLGYLLLGNIGWRYFIVCTSVPIFIPPLFILHCYLKDSTAEERVGLLSKMDSEVITVEGFWGRVIKGSIANFINTLQGWGSILLIPALLTYLNKQEIQDDDKETEGDIGVQMETVGDRNNDITLNQGLLIQALLYGGVTLAGRIMSIFLLKHIRFRILQPLLSLVMASCYLVLMFCSHSLVITVVAMGIANMCFCVTRCELTLMEFDKTYFGTSRLVLAAGIMGGCAMLGAVFGTTTAQFLTTPHAVIVTFVLSCVQVVTFCCITER